MPIREIVVHDYKKEFGKNREEHQNIKAVIHDLIQSIVSTQIEDLYKLDVFRLNASIADYKAGNQNRSIIYCNASFVEPVSEQHDVIINNLALQLTTLNPSGKETNIILKSENDVPLAEYQRETNELVILFDIFDEYNDQNTVLFRYIMNKYVEQVWRLINLEYSWIHTSDKESLTKRFTERLKQTYERIVIENKETITRYEQNIESFKRKIKNTYDSLIHLRLQQEAEQENANNIMDKLIKDLDLIVKHPKISDLQIKDNIFSIFVTDVICHDDKDRHFRLGNFKVNIDLENADIAFFGDTPRMGYWTSHDPHPHVNGNSGTACLGNVSSTIAELSSRNEIYALALIAIDFLSSANTHDSAGKNVVNWDRCDEEGNLIDTDDSDVWKCQHCNTQYHVEQEQYTVFNSIDDDGNPTDEATVCTHCLENQYAYWESLDVYVHTSYDEEDYQ